MSFHVYLGEGEEWGACVGNYTSNVGAFFAWALDGTEIDDPSSRCDSRDAILGREHTDGLITLDGMRAGDAAARIARALTRILGSDPTKLARFDAPNGWGSWQGATNFLHAIYESCLKTPAATLHVSQ